MSHIFKNHLVMTKWVIEGLNLISDCFFRILCINYNWKKKIELAHDVATTEMDKCCLGSIKNEQDFQKRLLLKPDTVIVFLHNLRKSIKWSILYFLWSRIKLNYLFIIFDVFNVLITDLYVLEEYWTISKKWNSLQLTWLIKKTSPRT